MESQISAVALLKRDALSVLGFMASLPKKNAAIWLVPGFVLVPALAFPLVWAADESRYWSAYAQLVAANLLELLALAMFIGSAVVVYRLWVLAKHGKVFGIVAAVVLLALNMAYYVGIRELPGVGWRIEARDSAESEPADYP